MVAHGDLVTAPPAPPTILVATAPYYVQPAPYVVTPAPHVVQPAYPALPAQ